MPPSTSMVGEQFGNYRALALLGEGGMGSVYLAEHPDIGRRVAIKVLRRELGADAQVLGRLLNEARAANAIRHPNIIEILDSGVTQSGASYLVMELLDGESLAARLRRMYRLTVADALAIAFQTASAVGAAHAKGIIHRDLKPDNLFLVPDALDPSRERVKVLDFGIAKLQGNTQIDSVKTRTGALMGTPIYMSPEQCLGTKEVDHRSDVYALGIILYEMLAGQPPFVSNGLGALVNMHLNEAPPSLQAAVPGLPDGVEALVLSTLSKSADHRIQTMALLQQAILEVARRAGVECGSLRFDGSPTAPPPNSRVTPHARATPAPTLPVPSSSSGMETPWTLPAPKTPMSGPMSMPAPVVPARPTASSPSRPTTLGGHASERLTPQEARPPARSRSVVPAVLAAAAVLGLGVLAWRAYGPKPAQPARAAVDSGSSVATPRPLQRVRLWIGSTPPGARLVRTSDGAVLGVTPQELELEAQAQPLELRLEKDGHLPVTRAVPLREDTRLEIALTKEEKAPAPADAPTKPPKPAHKPHGPRPFEPAKL